MTQSEVPQEEYDQTAGPGAPIPLSQLVVSYSSISNVCCNTDTRKGISGLTERDIKLVQEGGYHTVESIAYT